MISIEEICGYLPYGLNVIDSKNKVSIVAGLDRSNYIFENGFSDIKSGLRKPILRRLSDLTREIEHQGERFVPSNVLMDLFSLDSIDVTDYGISIDNGYACSYSLMRSNEIIQKLYSWHFWTGDQSRFGKDIIDINTLNNNQ